MRNLRQTIFALESVAHLQGRERELLPMVEAAKRELEFLLSPPEAFTEFLSAHDSLEAIVRPNALDGALSALVGYLHDHEADTDEILAFLEGFDAASA